VSITNRSRADAWLGSASAVLAAAVTVQVAVSVLEQGVPTLAFAFKRDLALSATEVGLLVSSFNLGRMAGSVPWGRAVDAQGVRRILAVGGFGLALLAGATSISPDGLVAPCLFAAGVFAASVSPAGIKLLMGVYPSDKHGLVVGLRQTAIPVGGALAAFTLPALAVAVDWRFAIACAGVGVLLATIPVVLSAPSRESFEAPAQPRPRRGSFRRFAGNGIGPVTGWGMVLVAAQYGVVTYGIIVMEERFGLSIGYAALVVGLAQLAGASGRVGWVLLGDRFFSGRPRATMVALTLVGIAGLTMIVALPAAAGPLPVTAAFLLTGVAVTGWPGLYVSFLSARAPAAEVGATIGFSFAFINLAALAGPPLLGLVVDLAGDHRAAWGLLAAALAASLLSLRHVREPRGAEHAIH
jgi:MFS family permease